jgi:osmotically-inducible protein OsmY
MTHLNLKHLLPAALVATAFLAGCGTLAGSPDRGDSAPHRTVGEAVDDATIVTELKAKLAADSELSALKINVDSTQGFVRLRGEVKTFALRQKADAMARAIKGVKSVDNQLLITG